MGWLTAFYQFWHSYGSDIQNGAVVLSAIAAFAVIYNNRKIAGRRSTMDLILHQESDRELIEARIEFNKIKVGEVRPSTYGKPDKKNDPEAQIVRRVLNVHELTAVAIKEGVIDERVYRKWFNTTYIGDYDAMKDYITEARLTYLNPRAFCEFESTATRWKEDRHWGSPPSWFQRKLAALCEMLRA